MWCCNIHEYVKCTLNVHNSYIDNIGIPKHEKHLRLLSSGTKLFITFKLKGFLTWGRERHNLSMTTLPSNPNHVRHLPQGLGEPRKSTVFLGCYNSIQLTFFQIPKILRARFKCITSFTSRCLIFYLGFLLWHLWMTRPLCIRMNTYAHVCT